MTSEGGRDRERRDDWDHHWGRYGAAAERNAAQDYRRELIFRLLDIHGTGEGIRILDIGSGQGDMAAAICARYPAAQIMGLELAHSAVAIARRKAPSARFVQRDLLEAIEPAEDQRGWATHAICSEVIEHVEDPSVLLRHARPYLGDGACLIVTAPGGPMSAFDRHIGHRKHWRREEIDRLLRDAGYAPENVSGAGFPFFNLYRCVVVLRGRRLIDDVNADPATTGSWLARFAMAIFDWLLRPHLNSSRRGWQMVGKARTPRAASGS